MKPIQPTLEEPSPYSKARLRVRAGADPGAEAACLVSLMTVEEKLGCLDGDTEFWAGLIDMVSGGYYRHPFPAARVERLGFPGLRFTDGPRGVVVGASTCFPVPMARGATFDPALEERIGDAIGVEARLQSADFFGGVCVNLLRHPAWGRAQETYGEDPFHVGEMGAALTRGVQKHVMACVKHFACNSIENARFQVNVLASPDVLEDVYLPHFRRVVEEGVAAVMTAYNAVNGQWCGQSRELIAATLRGRWGFDGIVMSDFVYGLRDPVASIEAGLDIEMPFRQQRAQSLGDALAKGSLAMASVDAAAARIIRTVLRFDAARTDAAPDPGLLAGPQHRALAREAAADAIVLLRNEPIDGGCVLPIPPDAVRRIALLGRLCDAPNLGDRGSSNVHPPSVVTTRAGLHEALPGVEWTEDAALADLAIVVVGCTFEDEGEYTGAISPELFALMPPVPDEDVWSRLADAHNAGLGMALGGDRLSLALSDEDQALIASVAAVQPRTVVLMVGGSAFTVEPWIDSVAAALHVWYPGMEGGRAIADVLTGAVNPGGRLPFAVPTDESHLAHFDPDAKEIGYDRWHGQWLLDRDGHEARFPFGFGLSYTHFDLTRVRLRERPHAASPGVACVEPSNPGVVVDVANSGGTGGAVVVFAFGLVNSDWRVVGFAKARIPAGRSIGIDIPVSFAGRVRVGFYAGDPQSIEIDTRAHA